MLPNGQALSGTWHPACSPEALRQADDNFQIVDNRHRPRIIVIPQRGIPKATQIYFRYYNTRSVFLFLLFILTTFKSLQNLCTP
jgi:hypothetical protein